MQVKDQQITSRLDALSISEGASLGDDEVEQSRDHSNQLISVALSKAVQLWLRSQLQGVDTLDVTLSGRNLAFLKGQIPQVKLFAHKAVYQGLHLTQMHIVGSRIRINLGQVLKGKPLRLLEPIPVTCQLILDDQDLNASLSSLLLTNGLNDLLLPWLRAAQLQLSSNSLERLQVHQIQIAPNGLNLHGDFLTAQEKISFSLQTHLELLNPHTLCLNSAKIKISSNHQLIPLENLMCNLGLEVNIQNLNVEAGKLHLQGQIQINP